MEAARREALIAMGASDVLDASGGPSSPARHGDTPGSVCLQCVSAEAMGIDTLGEGDKVLLPPSTLQRVLATLPHGAEMPEPLIFKVRVDAKSAVHEGAPSGGREAGGGGAGGLDGDSSGTSALDCHSRHSPPTRHVGVREFTADEGTVIMPLWILRSLGASVGDRVVLETATLPRGTFAKLQPIGDELLYLDDPRATLEAALFGTYTTLTLGDSVIYKHAGEVHELFVIALEPAETVCVVETELEVDFSLSVEGASADDQRALLARREEERRAREAEAVAEAAKARAEAKAAEAAAAKSRREREEAEAVERAAARSRRLAALPAEPALGADATPVTVRMPNGRISRRFAPGSLLADVRAWVEAAAPAELLAGQAPRFSLVTNFPRFVASEENEQVSLEEAGLAGSAGCALFFNEEELEAAGG